MNAPKDSTLCHHDVPLDIRDEVSLGEISLGDPQPCTLPHPSPEDMADYYADKARKAETPVEHAADAAFMLASQVMFLPASDNPATESVNTVLRQNATYTLKLMNSTYALELYLSAVDTLKILNETIEAMPNHEDTADAMLDMYCTVRLIHRALEISGSLTFPAMDAHLSKFDAIILPRIKNLDFRIDSKDWPPFLPVIWETLGEDHWLDEIAEV